MSLQNKKGQLIFSPTFFTLKGGNSKEYRENKELQVKFMRTMCSNDVQELITIFSTCDVLHKISFFPESCRLHLSVAGVEGGQMLADLNCQPQ